MQNNNHQRKYPRGISPHQEMKRGFDTWVRRLRSLEQAPADSLTPMRGIGDRSDRKIELPVQESGPQRLSGDEGRWQDDGGEGG